MPFTAEKGESERRGRSLRSDSEPSTLAVAGLRGGAGEQEDEHETADHVGELEVLGDSVKTVEVGVVGVGGRDTVDGAADGDAVDLHVGHNPELRECGESHHDDGDDDGRFDAAHIDAAGAADGEESKDDAARDEAFVVENVEAFGDDGAGDVGVRDSAEGSRGGDNEEEHAAEPDDERQPDDGAYEGFHVHNRVQRSVFGNQEKRRANG
jgi:hypothetical protein